jgi:hypothetical protein
MDDREARIRKLLWGSSEESLRSTESEIDYRERGLILPTIHA